LIGLAIIAGLALYIGIFWLIVRALKHRWAKALALLVALVIPFWDWPIGYYHFREQCITEGGLHVKRSFPSVWAIAVDANLGYRGEELIKKGFQVIEIVQPNGNVRRYSIDEKSSSSFRPTVMVYTKRNQLMPWHLLRNDVSASIASSGEVLATHTAFHWQGMWWQAVAAPMLGVGNFCHTTDEASLITSLLKGNR
jgi:hypothetical protein